MSSNAKLAYLLSICFKLTNGVTTVMTKQYEKSRTLATRHYFTFNINFYEPVNSSNFEVKNVYCLFSESKDDILMEALQYYNNEILCSNEIELIYNNLINQNIQLTAHQIVAIYSIATLIKLYRYRNFKYIFIPVVINYGRDSHLLHQTSLIIDISQDQCKIIYYEPYGKYSKYGKSYKDAVGKLFQCFKGFICFSNEVKYTTYHDMLGITDGIQQILLNKNNIREEEFKKQYSVVVDKLFKEFPNNNFTINSNKPGSNDDEDKTVKILDILFNTDYFDIDNLNDEKKKIYYEILDIILTQYCCFNSKTCVSITIVEMNKFFKYSQSSNHNLSIIKTKISEMYQSYINNSTPNIVLMTEIYSLIDLFKYSNRIKELLNEKKQPNIICKNL